MMATTARSATGGRLGGGNAAIMPPKLKSSQSTIVYDSSFYGYHTATRAGSVASSRAAASSDDDGKKSVISGITADDFSTALLGYEPHEPIQETTLKSSTGGGGRQQRRRVRRRSTGSIKAVSFDGGAPLIFEYDKPTDDEKKNMFYNTQECMAMTTDGYNEWSNEKHRQDELAGEFLNRVWY